MGISAEAVGDRPQVGAEGVGGAADVPAQRAGRHPAEDDAGLPRLAEDLVEAVHPPDREQVGDAAAADPDDVLREQVRPHVGHRRHREQAEVADLRRRCRRTRRRRRPRAPGRRRSPCPGSRAAGRSGAPASSNSEVEHRARAPVVGAAAAGGEAHARGDDRGCGRRHAPNLGGPSPPPPGVGPVDNAGGGCARSPYGLRHVRCRRPPPTPRRWCPATPWRRGWGGAARARCGGRCRAGAARRWPSRCWWPAIRNGRPGRRPCSGRSTTRISSACSRSCTSRSGVGRPRVALVLELLPGGSLAALLARRGRLRPGEVVTAIAPVAAALAHAHEQRRRPRRPLARATSSSPREGRPVLTDLGVARVLGETAAGEVTPAYVDPTVARGGAPGPASDVFGVAAAAFHALTGIAPWNAATPGDTLRVAADGLLPDLAELAPGGTAGTARRDRPRVSPPIRTTAGRRPRSPWTCGTPAGPSRCGCPQDGVPDAELGVTGRGPRTELTHQVPGRPPRPAPVVVGRGRPAARAGWPSRAAAPRRRPSGGAAAARSRRPGGERRRLGPALGSADAAALRPRRRRRSPRRPPAAWPRRPRVGRAGDRSRSGAPWSTGSTERRAEAFAHGLPELLDDVYVERQRAAGGRRRVRAVAGGRGGGAARFRARRSRR